MKIVIIVPYFPPVRYGGTEIATRIITAYLAARGHEVHVITISGAGLKGESKENGYYVHHVHYPSIRLFGGILFWAIILILVRDINPEIILCQSIFIGIGGLLSKICFKKPYIVWGRGSDIYLPTLFEKYINKIILWKADVLIALTDDMKKEMEKVSHRNICVISNGIQMEEFEKCSKDKIRNNLKIAKEQKIIMFVGNLRPVKGLKYLLKALKSVIAAGLNVVLVIVGDGEERSQLQCLATELNLKQQIYFIGSVKRALVPEYMAAADVFVLPSLSEGFPNVLLEAMASGLPIVTTNVGGIPEIIEDQVNGFIVEPKNPSQIAHTLTLLLSDQKLQSVIAKHNIEKAKKYNWQNIIDRLEAVLYSVNVNK